MPFPPQIAHVIYLGIALVLFMYFIVIYNNLVTLKNNVRKAWSNIDVLLKQRHDELPKLIETCKQYMQYERGTLDQITKIREQAERAREQKDVDAVGKLEGLLKGSLGNLFALAENYPQLKADETYQHLQKRISDLENSIADRRELYNESATLNNIRIEQFPDIFVASLLSFKPFKTLEFAQESGDVDVSAQFKNQA